MKEKKYFLEKKQKFSESILWKLQNEAYSRFGPSAWIEKGVPFYLTSNPYTAKQYAALAVGFLRDCLQTGASTPIDIEQPLYIFDLGAGTGRFGYLFLKELLERIECLWQSNIQIRYVMTDIAYSNLTFWEQHPYLQTYIQAGILDFAYYSHDLPEDQPIKLMVSKKILTPSEVQNPLILIANYFFDTIPQDLFRIKDGHLHEGLVDTSVKTSLGGKIAGLNDPSLINHLECQYHYVPLKTKRYYQHAEWDRLLGAYLHRFDNTTFLFPRGALQSLEYFSTLSRNRLFLLAGDQGVSTEAQVKEWGEPRVDRHGSFSIAVSYHALGLYFQQRKGAALLTSFSDPLFVVIAGILGGSGEKYPETRLAFRDNFDYFEPQDYWKIINEIENRLEAFSLSYLLKLIRLGNWDPINFHLFFEAIRKKIPDASDSLKKELGLVINKVWEHFYPVDAGESDFVLNLGVLFYELKNYEEALCYFKRSLDLSGEKAATLMNMAACYLSLGNQKASQDCFRRAKRLELS